MGNDGSQIADGTTGADGMLPHVKAKKAERIQIHLYGRDDGAPRGAWGKPSLPTKRYQDRVTLDKDHNPMLVWTLTPDTITDVVKLRVRLDVLPVIFLPGIMGSNLMRSDDKSIVWRLDMGWSGALLGAPSLRWALFTIARMDAGKRQFMLDKDKVQVDGRGDLPSGVPYLSDAELRKRGWGQVGESSYSAVLKWLQIQLNPERANPAQWRDYRQDEATLSAIPAPDDQAQLFEGVRMRISEHRTYMDAEGNVTEFDIDRTGGLSKGVQDDAQGQGGSLNPLDERRSHPAFALPVPGLREGLQLARQQRQGCRSSHEADRPDHRRAQPNWQRPERRRQGSR